MIVDEDETGDNRQATVNDEELARQMQVCVFAFLSQVKHCFVRYLLDAVYIIIAFYFYFEIPHCSSLH